MTEAERAELDLIGGSGDDRWSNAQMNGTFISVDGSGVEVRVQRRHPQPRQREPLGRSEQSPRQLRP